MNILNTFLGKKKTFTHPVLGLLESQRIKGNDQTKSYTWYGKIVLSSQLKETTIILEGNNSRPSTTHLDCISTLIQNWEKEYLPKIADSITKKGFDAEDGFANWKAEFYLSAIYPMNDKNPEFELTLEPLNNTRTDTISIELKNTTITKVERYS